MNDAEPRAAHIDPALAAAGWGVVAGSRIRRDDPITLGRWAGLGRRGTAPRADDVLIYRNTKPAVAAAKGRRAALARSGVPLRDGRGRGPRLEKGESQLSQGD
jgi:type I restriction enzyme R subunit